MKLYSVYDPEFHNYGQVMGGYDTAALLDAMNTIDFDGDGVAYLPSIEKLEACDIFADLRDRAFGGMPIEIGMCWGHNTKLNCLEYHRDSEINIGTEDFVLLVAKREDMVDNKLDTSKVMAFVAPAGAVVEVYATTLHYAPCHNDAAKGFRTAVVLPLGTNEAMPSYTPGNEEDRWMTACNKWLLAHEDSSEAKSGAYVGLTGKNIDLDVD